jgi:hypothetical protein
MEGSEIVPIRILGAAILVFTVCGALFFFIPASSAFLLRPDIYSTSIVVFVSASLLFYFFTGLGAFYCTRWGYRLLKVFLYPSLLAFPIGTAIGYGFLRYIKRHGIESYFRP